MKKTSFAAILTCALLVLTVAVATLTIQSPGANAAGIDNNVIIASVNSAVGKLAPVSLVVNKSLTLQGGSLLFEILPLVPGQSYSGHITLTITSGSSTTTTAVWSYVTENWPASIAETKLRPDINADFTGFKLSLRFDDSTDPTASITVKALVTYTVNSNVTLLP